MADIQGTNVAAGIAPFSTDDTFATHYAKYGQGGWHSVATIAERDAIAADRREEGMAVYVTGESKLYVLENSSFVELELGGGSGEVSDDQIAAAVSAYLAEHPVDISSVYTEVEEGNNLFNRYSSEILMGYSLNEEGTGITLAHGASGNAFFLTHKIYFEAGKTYKWITYYPSKYSSDFDTTNPTAFSIGVAKCNDDGTYDVTKASAVASSSAYYATIEYTCTESGYYRLNNYRGYASRLAVTEKDKFTGGYQEYREPSKTLNSDITITVDGLDDLESKVDNVSDIVEIDYGVNLFDVSNTDYLQGFCNSGTADGETFALADSFMYFTTLRLTHKIYLEEGKTYKYLMNLGSYGGYNSTDPTLSTVAVLRCNEDGSITGYKGGPQTAEVYEGNTASWVYILFTAPTSDYYMFNIPNSMASTMVIAEYDKYPENYVAYTAPVKKISDDVEVGAVETLSTRLDNIDVENKVDYTTYTSKNLFNPAEIQTGYRISYNSKPAAFEGSCISGKIPVEPNTTYHFHKPSNRTGNERTLCIYNATDDVVYATDGGYDDGIAMSTYGSHYLIMPSRTDGWFTTPSTASYVRFNLEWYGNYTEGEELEEWQLELGKEFTGYEAYYEPYKAVASTDLPKAYQALPSKVETLEEMAYSSGSVTKINVKSSDKIGFFSNSFLNGYAMYGQHAIERVMQFCDYLPYNYSKSGDDMAEEAYRLDDDQTFLGVCKPSEIGPLKYGIIMHQDNDGIIYSMNHRSYYENAKHLGYSIMSLGAEPVISTEHDWANNYLVFQRLCQDEGWEFLDWGKIAAEIESAGRYTPFWHSGHPATRTNWLQVYGFLPFVMSRPRPEKSMKLFRLRSSVDTSDLKNLLYNTTLERIERFQELHNGQAGLTDPKYFDRWGSTGYATTNYNCEYQDLIKNNSVSFGSYLLADITTPYNTHSITYGKLSITGTGIDKVYARKIRYMDNCWLPSGSSKYLAFGVTEGIENLPVGTTFTVSGITREDGTNINGVTFTVGSIVNGNTVVTTTATGSTYITSGTDVPICSVSGVTMSGTYDYPNASYSANWDKPLGEWEEVTMTTVDGGLEVTLSSEQLEKFGAEDKYVFLATGTDITITDIEFNCSGASEKLHLENKRRILAPVKGSSLMVNSLMTTDDTAWNNLSNIATVTPITDGTYTEKYPFGTVNRKFMTGDWVSQEITNLNAYTETKFKKATRVQVQLLARYFPKYVLTDDDYAESGVTPDCTFMSKMEVQVSTTATPSSVGSQFPVTTFYIGGWWNVFTFEFDINDKYNYLILKALGDNIEVGACWLVPIDESGDPVLGTAQDFTKATSDTLLTQFNALLDVLKARGILGDISDAS